MTSTYTLTIYDGTPHQVEAFEAEPENVTTESTENGERVVAYDSPDDPRLEVFVPKGTAYALRKGD